MYDTIVVDWRESARDGKASGQEVVAEGQRLGQEVVMSVSAVPPARGEDEDA